MSCCCSFKFHHSIRFCGHKDVKKKEFYAKESEKKHFYLIRISPKWIKKPTLVANDVRSCKNANCLAHLIFVTFCSRPARRMYEIDDNNVAPTQHPERVSDKTDPQVSNFCVKKSAQISFWVQRCVMQLCSLHPPLRPQTLSPTRLLVSTQRLHTEFAQSWKKIPAARAAQRSPRNCVSS